MPAPVVSSQQPNPSSTENILRPQIQFVVTSDNGLSRLQFYTNGTLSYDSAAGGFQTGYVPSVDWNTPGGVNNFGNTTFVEYNQTAFFVANSVNTIRCVATDNSAQTSDTSWTFQCTNTPHAPYAINLSSAGYSGFFTINDPLRFDLIVDPIDAGVIDPSQTDLNLGGAGHPIIAGVAQAGWTFSMVAVLGGYRYEVIQTPAGTPWSLGGGYAGNLFTGTVGGFHRTADIDFNFSNSDPAQPTPPDNGFVVADWKTEQPTSAFLNLVSGLGVPTLDTLHAQFGAHPPVLIYDSSAGGFQAGWEGALADAGLIGPFPPAVDQGVNVLFGAIGSYAPGGVAVLFNVTGHIVSPSTGVNYPIAGARLDTPTGAWLWNTIAASISGKKYAVETLDPRTIVVRTTLDGTPTDCDFNLSIGRIRVQDS